MIVIAALALGLIPARFNLPFLEAKAGYFCQELKGATWENGRIWFLLFGRPGLAEAMGFGCLLVLLPFLMCWTAALLAMRLRQPRPSWREVARQPGLWSCVAPLVALFAVPWWAYFGIHVPPVILPSSVAIVWLALALSREWRPERSWIDRAGRVTGLIWLATALPCIYWGDRFGFGFT